MCVQKMMNLVGHKKKNQKVGKDNRFWCVCMKVCECVCSRFVFLRKSDTNQVQRKRIRRWGRTIDLGVCV